jgi:lipoprotein-anchoring transpeptidase ErfK/SrfK
MSRLAYATLLTTCLTAGTAFAAPLNLNPSSAPPAPAPERQVVAQGPSTGGGLIETLFRSGGQPRTYAQPEPMAPAYQQPRTRLFTPDGDYVQPAAIEPSRRDVDPRYQRQEVNYDGRQRPGTIIIDTKERLLYLVKENGRATRYGIGVGRPGFTWAGTHSISSKREWPDWRPPPEMIRRQPNLPRHMRGGPDNPLGARAMYLGSTLYRIHGSNEPWTIGQAVSSGCIRMRNEDVIHLYNQVRVGTKVVVI